LKRLLAVDSRYSTKNKKKHLIILILFFDQFLETFHKKREQELWVKRKEDREGYKITCVKIIVI
tara:strand:- start:348 stop:539 length:192 start_codon:yes stop_codon:yes gene_type:complete